MPKNFYFDMDGTIIDSRSDLAATVNHTRSDMGLEPLKEEEVLIHVGRGAKHLLECAIPESTMELSKRLEIFMSHYAEHMLERVTLYPGVEETLELLASRGCRLGINTAKPAFAVKAILEKFDIARFFGAGVVAVGDCKEMKPSPLPLRQCASQLGVELSPEDWMVGDNWTDVECGVNAGVKTAFCSFGFGFLSSVPPTRQIATFADLLNC